jgi:RsiW-degrading membrane proteinase PrsW (M82 family)
MARPLHSLDSPALEHPVRARRFVVSGWLGIAAQIALLALLFLVGATTPLAGGPATRALTLLAVVLVPSIIWVGFFAALDRDHPEPTRHVLGAFILGMASASLLALPIERHLFGLQDWMYQSLGALVLGAALVRGTLFGFAIYLGVRYGLLPSPEFDEPADGVVYGAAMGSGYAAVQSLAYLTTHAEFVLFAAGYTAAVNILVYSSAGAAVGYLIGATKFRPAHARRTLAGAVLLGVALIAAQHALTEFVLVGGLARAFWSSFALSATFAVIVLGVVTRRLSRFTPAPVPAAPPTAWRPDWPVLGLAALLLGTAAVARWRLTHETFSSEQVSFRYSPARLRPAMAPASTAPGTPLFTAVGGAHGRYAITVLVRDERIDLESLDPAAYLGHLQALGVRSAEVTIAGKRGLRVRYAFLTPPADRLSGLPELQWGCTDIVPGEDRTVVLTYRAAPDVFAREQAVYDDLLRTLRWSRPGGRS